MAVADEVLVARTRNGDMAAFEELVVRYQRLVFSICYRMLGQREEAEDLSQEIFLTIYRKLDLFDPERKFTPWLHRVTVNCCLSRLRKNKKVITVDFEDGSIAESWANNEDHQVNPELALERLEQKEIIQQALSQLPESYRLILVMRYQLDLSNQEIADALGISRENTEVRLYRARQALRRVLSAPVIGGYQDEMPANR